MQQLILAQLLRLAKLVPYKCP